MNPTQRHCTPGMRAYQWIMEVDRTARLQNQDRLWQLSCDRPNDVRLFCSHDAVELDAFVQSSTQEFSLR